MRKKEGRIKKAYSRSNGIIFYAKKHEGMCVETFIDKAGEEHVRIVPAYLLELKKFTQRYGMDAGISVKKFRKMWAIISVLTLLVLTVVFRDFNAIISGIYLSAYTIPSLIIIFDMYWQMKIGNETELSTGRFHSAEHMAISAYNRLDRVPTVKEIKKESHFSKLCGSNFIFTRIISSLWLITCWLNAESLGVIIYMILVIFGIIVIEFLGRCGVFNGLQMFVTANPTDTEIHLAQKGIELLDKLENEDVDRRDFISSEEMLKEILSIPHFVMIEFNKEE